MRTVGTASEGPALVLAALLALPAALPAQDPGVMAVADAASGEIALLDGTCWGVSSRLSVGGEVHQVTQAHDGSRAYVAHSTGPTGTAGDGAGEGAVTVLDLGARRAVRRFELGRTGDVTDVWPGHEGSRIWVAAERDGRVLTLQSGTGDLLMEWTIGRTSPQSGAVSRDDRYLFVTNREAGTLTVIDRVTVAANTVDLDRGAGAVAVGPSGEAWVADRDDDRLWVVDGRSGEVVAELPTRGSAPVQVQRRPGEREVWVLHRDSGGLQVFDTYRQEPAGHVDLPGTPRAFRFSEDGSRALVTIPGRGLVLTVDASGRRVTATNRVSLSPGALAWSSCPDGECERGASRWEQGAAGLPGEGWTGADFVGDLWCGG